MEGRKKIIFYVLPVIVVIAMVFGVTYAMFNYSKAGNDNVVSTSSVRFSTTGSLLIDVATDFPQDMKLTSEALQSMKNDHKGTLSITSNNTLEDGITYKIYAVYDDDITGKIRLKDENIMFQLTPNFTNGTNGFSVIDNYYEDANNLFIDGTGKALLATGIVKNTTELATVTYDYYMWIGGDNIHVSSTVKRLVPAEGNPSLADTSSGTVSIGRYMKNDNTLKTVTLYPAKAELEGKTIYTTKEFSNSYYNIKIVVEADEYTKEKSPIITTILSDLNTETTINYSSYSGENTGGLYLLPGTENYDYPIYFYRGDVTDNNVVFGGYCWQMVRTTDTGGVKMVYNGEASISGSGENTTYDCSSSSRPESKIGEIGLEYSLYSTQGYFYADDYEVVRNSNNVISYRLKSNTNPITQVPISGSNAATAIPNIVSNYPYTCLSTDSTATCTNIFKVDSHSRGNYAIAYPITSISAICKGQYNGNYQSLAYAGYMYNTVFTNSNTAPLTDVYFGASIEYGDFDNNGTSEYRLIDTSLTKDNNHHYTCNLTSAAGTCASVFYYYFNNYRIELINGYNIEDALYLMTGTGSEEVKLRNKDSIINNADSAAKSYVDTWFQKHLTNEINSNNTNYQNYLEDTIFCNDRSFKTVSGSTSYPTYIESGWNKDGGDLTKFMSFGIYNRYYNNWLSTTNVPSVKCENITDRFSVSNSKAKLKYPVGLLNTDEIIMAGAHGNGTADNRHFYLNIFEPYWLMTPRFLNNGNINMFALSATGNLTGNYAAELHDIRPVVSLKSSTEFVSGGDGTASNPYVVKYN